MIAKPLNIIEFIQHSSILVMYRALSLLFVLRDSGEDGLQQCIWQVHGVTKSKEGG